MLKKMIFISALALTLSACANSYTAISANNAGIGAAVGTGLRW